MKKLEQKRSILHRANEYVLVVMSGIAFLLVIAGLALYLAGNSKSLAVVPLRQVWDGLLALEPASVIASGIIMLFALPVALATISTLVLFWKRERMLALAAFAVLLFLCVSVFLAVK
jgi:uncharacterized membrane protein